ncbi:hypothetical protein BD413DRAFT_240713 [Trametes elegans]|nr:hypothetical protein BD413DRAFT_240713 [Trametes elegans]
MHRSIVVTPTTDSSPRLRWARIRFSDGMATTCWPLRCPPSTTPCLPGPLLSYPSPQASVRLIPPGWTKIYKVPLVRCGSTAIKELDVSSLLGPSINQACFTTPRQEPPRKSTKATYYLGISSLILLLVLACWSSDCLYVRTTASSSEVGAETDIMIHRLPYRPPPHLHCTDMIRLSRQFTSRAYIANANDRLTVPHVQSPILLSRHRYLFPRMIIRPVVFFHNTVFSLSRKLAGIRSTRRRSSWSALASIWCSLQVRVALRSDHAKRNLGRATFCFRTSRQGLRKSTNRIC